MSSGPEQRARGKLFNGVAELYDRTRARYPEELIADLARIAGIGPGTAVLEVGCGTGIATVPLAGLGGTVTAVEPGPEMAAVARRRTAGADNVAIEEAAFEEWDDRGRRFDALVAASSWHWVDPAVGWPRAHALLRPGSWAALIGHVTVTRPGETEVYAETADLHERFSPGNPDWGMPPAEDEVLADTDGWGLPDSGGPGALFGPTTVRWYPGVRWFDGEGYADMLRSHSLYQNLPEEVREPLLDAVADRIRTRLGDRVPRRHLAVLRAGQRADGGQDGREAGQD